MLRSVEAGAHRRVLLDVLGPLPLTLLVDADSGLEVLRLGGEMVHQRLERVLPEGVLLAMTAERHRDLEDRIAGPPKDLHLDDGHPSCSSALNVIHEASVWPSEVSDLIPRAVDSGLRPVGFGLNR